MGGAIFQVLVQGRQILHWPAQRPDAEPTIIPLGRKRRLLKFVAKMHQRKRWELLIAIDEDEPSPTTGRK